MQTKRGRGGGNPFSRIHPHLEHFSSRPRRWDKEACICVPAFANRPPQSDPRTAPRPLSGEWRQKQIAPKADSWPARATTASQGRRARNRHPSSGLHRLWTGTDACACGGHHGQAGPVDVWKSIWRYLVMIQAMTIARGVRHVVAPHAAPAGHGRRWHVSFARHELDCRPPRLGSNRTPRRLSRTSRPDTFREAQAHHRAGRRRSGGGGGSGTRGGPDWWVSGISRFPQRVESWRQSRT